VDYDDAWPRLFAAERERLLSVVRAHAGCQFHLEHIGSTAVPGLAAKPVLDMLAAPWPGEELGLLIPAFEAAGYRYRPLQSTPERQFFRRGEPRQYHLHLTPLGSQVWRDQLGFRDLLRRDPGVASAYAALKCELAARYPADREAYIEGKTAFVRNVIWTASGDYAGDRTVHVVRRSHQTSGLRVGHLDLRIGG
jgi:GrpB-like predicted nucleotidyltransferase (UPF0157 family)